MNREAERKRLVELISDTNDLCQVKKAMEKGKRPSCEGCKYEYNFDCHMERIADKLLDNGIVVPPCKVGDKVYMVGAITRQIVSVEVVAISTSGNDFYLILGNGTWISCNQHIGKTVFLTREQAEKALEGKGE